MINIIDDLVSKDLQDSLENIMLNNTYMPWFLHKSTYNGEFNHNNVLETQQFVHTFYDEEGINSKYFEEPKKIIDLLSLNNLIRVKANLLLQNKNSDVDKHTTPHKDFNFDHHVYIYYVNDSDGDTFIFDEDLNVVKRVTPRKGRILHFDGKWLHASSSPITSNNRCIFNIDIKAQNE